MSDPIINKVAESGIITLDPEKYFPKEDVVLFDLKDYLFMGMILKEKDFREALKNTDWNQFQGKSVAIVCSADAIIPVWAYMLIASFLQPVAKKIWMGPAEELNKQVFLKNIDSIDLDELTDKRIVIKGCGETPIPDYVYMELTRLLRPIAKSIMYGEPCSTVPVFKKK
jgi:hypothetical protein